MLFSYRFDKLGCATMLQDFKDGFVFRMAWLGSGFVGGVKRYL
jgi:hypothetical protein